MLPTNSLVNLVAEMVVFRSMPGATTKVLGQSITTAAGFDKLANSSSDFDALSNLTALSGDIAALVGGPIPTVVGDGLQVGHDALDVFGKHNTAQMDIGKPYEEAADEAFVGSLTTMAGDVVTLVGDILSLGGHPCDLTNQKL